MVVLRRDGSVLRVAGMQALAELILDGFVGEDDRLIGPARRLGDISEMAWAFALGGSDEDDEPAPYETYEIAASDGG